MRKEKNLEPALRRIQVHVPPYAGERYASSFHLRQLVEIVLRQLSTRFQLTARNFKAADLDSASY